MTQADVARFFATFVQSDALTVYSALVYDNTRTYDLPPQTTTDKQYAISLKTRTETHLFHDLKPALGFIGGFAPSPLVQAPERGSTDHG